MNCISTLWLRLSSLGVAGLLLAGLLLAGLTCFATMAASVRSQAADATSAVSTQPQLAEASQEAEQSMRGIALPQHWEISLFAAEPDVANIVAFDIDHQGRVFVCETYRQERGVTDNRAHDRKWLLADLAAETVQDRIDYHKKLLGDAVVAFTQHEDRIRRVEDTSGDGRADRSTVLASGFNRLEEGTGASVLARGRDIYYTCIPKLWRLIDADDDGHAEERIALSDGYGVRVAFRGHDLHGLVIGPDGRLYFSIGDRGYRVTCSDGTILADPASGAVFRCELDGSALEVFATGLRNPQELAFNDWGDWFTVDNNSDSGDQARIVQLLHGSDSGWRMHYQYLPDRGPFNRDRLWEPPNPDQPAYIVPPIANLTDGPSGLVYYPGTGFGDRLQEQFLVCDFRGGPANSGVRSFRLEPAGAFHRLAEEQTLIWNVLATDVAFAPDGSLMISDWVDGWSGLGKGRLFRISDPEHRHSPIVHEVRELLASDWSQRDQQALLGDLQHLDRRVRLEAQWELARRGEVNGFLSIVTDANTEIDRRRRLHALWGLDQILRGGALANSQMTEVLDQLRPLLSDPDEFVRAAVAKFCGERTDIQASERLIQLTSDPAARVRYSATRALGRLARATAKDENREIASAGLIPVIKMLDGSGATDPGLRHAAIMYLADLGRPSMIEKLSAHTNAEVRRAAVVALRRLQSAAVAKFLIDPDHRVVGEAVRAIYDTPIPVAMDALAKLSTDSINDPEVLRRVINANYQLGNANAAVSVAKLAARLSTPEEVRVEALEVLGDWAQPNVVDRILHLVRPLAPRLDKIAHDALQPHIDDLLKSAEPVREKAIHVAAKLGIKSIVPQLSQRVSDSGQRPRGRAMALIALAELDPKVALKLARSIPLTPTTPLVPAALEVLARGDRVAEIDKFIQATELTDVPTRQLAWDILRTIDDPRATKTIEEGLRQYIQETLADEVRLNVLEAADKKISDELAQEVSAYQILRSESDPLGPWLDTLSGGNFAEGKKLFFERTELSCVRCHKVDRAGGEVGPRLTVIGKEKDARYLLESICFPDAAITQGYETTVIATADGDVLSGIVKRETDEAIELVLPDSSQRVIKQIDILARKKGKSSMPAELEKLMTPRELRDLIAYLVSLKVDPREPSDTK